MKIVFAGTPDFSVPALKAIASEHQVIAVFTQPDRRSGRGKKVTEPAVKVVAKSLNLEVHQPTSLRDQSELIAKLAPDVMVVVAYGVILPQVILDIPKLGCLNIHASLLPRWRGAAPIQRALEAGDTNTGVCIMQMEAGLDTGPVLQVQTIAVSPDDTSTSLHNKLADLGADAISTTLKHLEAGDNIEAIKQDDTLATYAKKISKDEANIDWSDSAQSIERRIRAFNPWPIMQTTHRGTRLRIWAADLDTELNANLGTKSSKAGEVVAVNQNGVSVACGEGFLRLQILQRDGSKPMPYKSFRNGYPILLKDTLG